MHLPDNIPHTRKTARALGTSRVTRNTHSLLSARWSLICRRRSPGNEYSLQASPAYTTCTCAVSAPTIGGVSACAAHWRQHCGSVPLTKVCLRYAVCVLRWLRRPNIYWKSMYSCCKCEQLALLLVFIVSLQLQVHLL